MTVYGDITPRTAAYAMKDMLKRGMPYLLIEKFGDSKELPSNSTKVAKFRRYFLSGSTGAAGNGGGNWYIPLATTPLVEGVTPAGKALANHDVTVTMEQFGDFTSITDVIQDTHEDPVLAQCTEILGEQAAQTIETVRFNVLKAGTNAMYVGALGAAVAGRNLVAGPVSRPVQRRATTALQRQQAKPLTSVLRSTPSYGTQSVMPAYIALVHPDLESDIRDMAGFKSASDYGSVTPFENEIGSVEHVRYLASTIFTPWADAGSTVAAAPGYRSTSGVNNDVYPILYIARNAYGIVPLKGKSAITPMVVNPKPAPGDPLGQRGTVGWKAYSATVILNDAWLIRCEVLASA